ncbi:MAG: WD40 repeat domain-containing protein [Gemmataceae bacterium]|nr:WD40 repeat domain-containing protein [Gemmataceae bacterium]
MPRPSEISCLLALPLLAASVLAQPKPLAEPKFLGNLLRKDGDGSVALSFSRDGRHLFASLRTEEDSPSYRCYDTESMKPVWEAKRVFATQAILRADSTLLSFKTMSGSKTDYTIPEFRTWTGGMGKWKEDRVIRFPDYKVPFRSDAPAWLPEQGDSLVFWVNDEIVIHDLKSGKKLGSLKVGKWSGSFHGSRSTDGKTLALIDKSHRVRLIDIESRKVVASFDAEPRPDVGICNWVFAITPDGKRLVVIDWSGSKLTTRDAGTGKVIKNLGTLHRDHVSTYALCMFPDGKTLALGDHLHGVALIDLETGKRRTLERKAAASGADSIAVSPDGSLLAWSRPGKLHVWRLKAKDPAEP